MKLNKQHRRKLKAHRDEMHAMLRSRVISRVGDVNVTYFAGFNYLWREGRVFPQMLGREVLAAVAMVKALEFAVFAAKERV